MVYLSLSKTNPARVRANVRVRLHLRLRVGVGRVCVYACVRVRVSTHCWKTPEAKSKSLIFFGCKRPQIPTNDRKKQQIKAP